MASNGTLCGLDWVRRTRWPNRPPADAPKLRVADLFCGCGGMTLGAWEAARQAGYRLDIRLAIDACDTAIDVFRSNFKTPKGVARCDDIRKLLPAAIGRPLRPVERKLRKEVGKLDLLLAGPPCQGHSDLNNHTRRKDRRNSLYLRVVRAVEVLKPTAVIVENVSPVIHDRGNVVNRSQRTLEKLGYDCATGVLRALDFGLPQRRKRHVLLAMCNSRTSAAEVLGALPKLDGKPTPISAYLEGLENEHRAEERVYLTPPTTNEVNRERIAYLFDHKVDDLPNHMRPNCHSNGHSYKSMYGRLRWSEPAQTITTGFGSMGQGRFVHPKRRRLITPHEAARLQGLPDYYRLRSVTKRTRLQLLIGNTVPPALTAPLVRQVMLLTVQPK